MYKGKSKQVRSSMAYAIAINNKIQRFELLQKKATCRDSEPSPRILQKMLEIKQRRALEAAAEIAKKGDPDAFTVVLQKIEQDNANITISSLSVSVGGKQLLNNASFAISFGKRYGLVGPSGSGKSTLLKLLAWRKIPVLENIDILLVEHVKLSDQKSVLEEVVCASEEVVKFRKEAAALEDLDLDLEFSSDYEKLAEWYESPLRLESDAAEAHASKILAGLGFTVEMQDRCATSFRGVWRMRIALARALFLRPTLLLLDEPTEYLGVRAALWLEEYLCHWENPLLVVSDQVDFLNTVCTDILHLHDQSLHIHHGKFAAAKEPFVGKGAQLHGLQEILEVIDRIVLDSPEPTKLFPPTFIQLTGVSFCYPYRRAGFSLSDVDLCISMGKRVAVVGPVRAGKSTLLKLVTGDLLPTEGEVTRSQELRIGMYSQHTFVDLLTKRETPVQHLLRLHPDQERCTKPEAVRAILDKFGVPSRSHSTPVAKLSLEEKARVALALAVMSKPHILLLDESTKHLEKETVDVLADELDGFKGALVLVSDDPRLVSRVCENKEKSEFWLVKDGAVTSFRGTFEEYKEVVLKREIKAEVRDLITSLVGLSR